jgi:hypothetical protein
VSATATAVASSIGQSVAMTWGNPANRKADDTWIDSSTRRMSPLAVLQADR